MSADYLGKLCSSFVERPHDIYTDDVCGSEDPAVKASKYNTDEQTIAETSLQ